MIYDRTSPTTAKEQAEILTKYILEAQSRDMDITIRQETLPIDTITPIHLELDKEQLDILRPIYIKNGFPPLIVEQVGNRLILLDGHHRTHISKYDIGNEDIDASVLYMETPVYDTDIGKTYGELFREDFIIA